MPEPDGSDAPPADDPGGSGLSPGPAGPGPGAPMPGDGSYLIGGHHFPAPDFYLPEPWPAGTPEGNGPGNDGAAPPVETPPPEPPAILQPPGMPLQPGNARPIPEHLQALHQQVVEQLRVEQALDASLPASWGYLRDVGGRMPSPRPVTPVRNGRWDHALNLASDPFGILAPLTDLQASLSHLSRMTAEREIEAMREQMRQAGVPKVPTHYQMAWVADGRSVRDYAATAQQLQDHYHNFLQDRRLSQSWGSHWRDIRLGSQHMTVPQFEQHMLDLQQRTANQAYLEALDLHSQGRLPIAMEGHRNPTTALNVAIGNFVDGQVRAVLRREINNLGLQDSPLSPIAAINRRITDPVTGRYGLPDARLGANLYADTTLAYKPPGSEQIRNWHAIRPGHYLIIRPDFLGDSYVISPDSIRPPPYIARKPGI